MSTKDFELTAFNNIEVGGAFEIVITRSNSFKVSVAADDFSRIRVEKIDDTLIIKRQGIDWLAPLHNQPKAIVMLPILKSLNISGASHGKLENLESNDSLKITLSGASHVEAHHISTGKLEMNVTGASHLTGEINATSDVKLEEFGASKIELIGMGASAVMKVTGASRAELSKFAIQNANMDVSGASKVFVNLNGRLDANVSGASNLFWSGSASMGDIQTSGASNLCRK